MKSHRDLEIFVNDILNEGIVQKVKTAIKERNIV
jgi:hypothetical protein